MLLTMFLPPVRRRMKAASGPADWTSEPYGIRTMTRTEGSEFGTTTERMRIEHSLNATPAIHVEYGDPYGTAERTEVGSPPTLCVYRVPIMLTPEGEATVKIKVRATLTYRDGEQSRSVRGLWKDNEGEIEMATDGIDHPLDLAQTPLSPSDPLLEIPRWDEGRGPGADAVAVGDELRVRVTLAIDGFRDASSEWSIRPADGGHGYDVQRVDAP